MMELTPTWRGRTERYERGGRAAARGVYVQYPRIWRARPDSSARRDQYSGCIDGPRRPAVSWGSQYSLSFGRGFFVAAGR